MDSINPYMVSIMGIMFEVLGALFLTIEAFGKNRVNKIFTLITKISEFSKKNFRNLILCNSPFILLIALGVIFDSEIFIGLIVPILILYHFVIFVLDNPKLIGLLFNKIIKEGKISPFGFIILLLGNLLQIISLIWQMERKI